MAKVKVIYTEVEDIDTRKELPGGGSEREFDIPNLFIGMEIGIPNPEKPGEHQIFTVYHVTWYPDIPTEVFVY